MCRRTYRWDVPEQRWVDYDPAAVVQAARELAAVQGIVWDLLSDEDRSLHVWRLVHVMAAFS